MLLFYSENYFPNIISSRHRHAYNVPCALDPICIYGNAIYFHCYYNQIIFIFCL